MRGRCSIVSCNTLDKIHDIFEALEGINICWQCGNKILDVIDRVISDVKG